MNVLAINGSPKGNRSNTWKLTKRFVEGMEAGMGASQSMQIQELQVSSLQIRPCLGCFSCWNKTPGTCCMKDDMEEVIRGLLRADVVIWSFPLYYYTVPGGLKNLIDRQLPMVLPYMVDDEGQTGSGSHPSRYDRDGQRHILISTCGFYSAEGNYDGVRSLFDHICGKGEYTAIFCGQGELFRVPELAQRTEEYLGFVREAGMEYVQSGIGAQTWEKLGQLLYPREVFESMADASWGIDKDTGERETEALSFTRQMAALYQRDSYPGRDMVLEICYTDLDECYQIVLGKEGSRVVTDGSQTAATRIETPYSVWRSIAAGEIRGDEALMKHMYLVKGDFELMVNWDRYFGGAGGAAKRSGDRAEQGGTGRGSADAPPSGICMPDRGTNMSILLIPWIVFWAAAPIDAFWGSILSLAACVGIPILFFRNRKTFYDQLSAVLVASFAVLTLSGLPGRLVVPLAYLAFGIMWTASCFRRIPLTAYYSMNQYNGEDALRNPLFMKTNRILTLLWGILYLLTPIWTYLVMGTGAGGWIGAINSILPVLMGIFTAWFQKWYPARIARG